MTQAKKGDSVQVNYVGKLEDGTIFDSSEGHEPLPVTLGKGEVIAGFEEAIIGMKQGESKSVSIPVEKAYGPVNEELIIKAPKDQVPPDINPEIGQQLQMGGPNGEMLIVKITEVTEEHIILDANPPLAGKNLVFEIDLVSIA